MNKHEQDYHDRFKAVMATLATRTMTPKSLVVPPECDPAELERLRTLIDEAKSDPNYSIGSGYWPPWDMIGKEPEDEVPR